MKKNKIIKRLIVIFISTIMMSGCKNKKDTTGIVYGDSNASIEIINYSSFQCGDCAIMHEKLGSSIKKYIESGDIKYIEKQVDIKRFEYDDFIYTHMTDEQTENFEELSKIYENQSKLIIMESSEEVTELVGLQLKKNKKHKKDIEEIRREKDKLGLKVVPTIFINGEKIEGNISKEEFENKIESLLNKK